MPSFKTILKKVGLVSEAVAPIFIPAAGPAISAVEAIVHRQGDDGQNIADALASTIAVMESLSHDQIADEAKVHAGILMMDAGRKLFLEGLKNQ